MDTAIVWSKDYELHATGSHPEGPDRVTRIVEYLRRTDLWPRLVEVAPRVATRDEILLVHPASHVDTIRRIAEGGGGEMDETVISPQSYDIALLAAGGVLTALDQWEDGHVAFAAVRPPGHHATSTRVQGFCIFNNIAIAARTLLDRGLERIAIIDWDVHHGNGTQAIFYEEPRVLFCSVHQWMLYPGSGWVDECGRGEGEGTTVNVALPSGSRDGDYADAFAKVVEPIVDQFAPEAVLVSAGFDPHVDESLASMRLSADGFALMALRTLRLAQRHAGGRLAFALEGGYDREATGASVSAVLRALVDEAAPDVGHATVAGPSIERARQAQSRFWTL